MPWNPWQMMFIDYDDDDCEYGDENDDDDIHRVSSSVSLASSRKYPWQVRIRPPAAMNALLLLHEAPTNALHSSSSAFIIIIITFEQ